MISVDVNQNLPLHLAAANGYEVVISQFLEKDISVSGFFGRKSLWNAAYRGHVKVVQLLLEIHGIDINASDNLSGIPILMSLCNNHPEVTRLLIDKGADVDTSSRFGYAPLHAAARNGNKKMSKKLLSIDGQTPFLLAVLSDNIELVDMLYEKGFDGSKIPDKRGYPCIHAVVLLELGNLEILQKLRALGAEPLAYY